MREKHKTHPWYVELECEKCGWKEYIFKRTVDAVTTAEWYERDKMCTECGSKRISVIGNVLTDNPPNEDLLKSGES